METRMGELPNPTPALARKIWESMAKPSTRRVATRLRQAGFSISHMRVARWRNRGWRPASREDHPLEVARAALNDAVPLLTSDPTTTAEVFVEQNAAPPTESRLMLIIALAADDRNILTSVSMALEPEGY